MQEKCEKKNVYPLRSGVSRSKEVIIDAKSSPLKNDKLIKKTGPGIDSWGTPQLIAHTFE